MLMEVISQLSYPFSLVMIDFHVFFGFFRYFFKLMSTFQLEACTNAIRTKTEHPHSGPKRIRVFRDRMWLMGLQTKVQIPTFVFGTVETPFMFYWILMNQVFCRILFGLCSRTPLIPTKKLINAVECDVCQFGFLIIIT